MPVTSAIRSIVAAVSNRIAAMRRMSEFTCADCDRSARCGLRPDDFCDVRAEQIARGDWERRRRAGSLLPLEPAHLSN